MNHKPVYRNAPATLGLLITKVLCKYPLTCSTISWVSSFSWRGVVLESWLITFCGNFLAAKRQGGKGHRAWEISGLAFHNSLFSSYLARFRLHSYGLASQKTIYTIIVLPIITIWILQAPNSTKYRTLPNSRSMITLTENILLLKTFLRLELWTHLVILLKCIGSLFKALFHRR